MNIFPVVPRLAVLSNTHKFIQDPPTITAIVATIPSQWGPITKNPFLAHGNRTKYDERKRTMGFLLFARGPFVTWWDLIEKESIKNEYTNDKLSSTIIYEHMDDDGIPIYFNHIIINNKIWHHYMVYGIRILDK